MKENWAGRYFPKYQTPNSLPLSWFLSTWLGVQRLWATLIVVKKKQCNWTTESACTLRVNPQISMMNQFLTWRSGGCFRARGATALSLSKISNSNFSTPLSWSLSTSLLLDNTLQHEIAVRVTTKPTLLHPLCTQHTKLNRPQSVTTTSHRRRKFLRNCREIAMSNSVLTPGVVHAN